MLVIDDNSPDGTGRDRGPARARARRGGRAPPRAQGGARARRTSPASAGARRRRRADPGDGLRLLARPEGRAAPDRGRGRRGRPRARLALRAGRLDPELGLLRRFISRGGCVRAGSGCRRACATSPAASSATGVACSSRSTSTRSTRRATRSRSRRRTARCGRASASSRSRSPSSTARRAARRCRGDRARGGLEGAGAPGRGAGGALVAQSQLERPCDTSRRRRVTKAEQIRTVAPIWRSARAALLDVLVARSATSRRNASRGTPMSRRCPEPGRSRRSAPSCRRVDERRHQTLVVAGSHRNHDASVPRRKQPNCSPL